MVDDGGEVPSSDCASAELLKFLFPPKTISMRGPIIKFLKAKVIRGYATTSYRSSLKF